MSSSDEDDERGRIAFTTEGDYEDGCVVFQSLSVSLCLSCL